MKNQHDSFVKDEAEQEELPLYNPVISYGADYTLDTISQYVENETIIIQPAFQRNFVWDIKKASKLIESFLLGYPVPNILLGRPQNDDRMEVIDGQQRIRTISGFINGVFNDAEFRLSGDIISKYADKTFDELDETDQRRFRNSVLKTTILVYQENDPDLKFSVFQRINTGSVVLNQQEIRNCIFGGSFNEFLHEVNRYPAWRSFFSSKPDKRMRDEETILRFFASYFDRENYEKPMTSFLNIFMSKHRQLGKNKQLEWKELFENTLDIIEENFDGNNPFSLKEGSRQFNRALFEAVMVAVATHKANGKSNFRDFFTKHKKLISDDDFIDSVSTGTSAEKKYTLRFEKALLYLK